MQKNEPINMFDVIDSFWTGEKYFYKTTNNVILLQTIDFLHFEDRTILLDMMKFNLFKYPNKTVYIKANSAISRSLEKKKLYLVIWFDWLPYWLVHMLFWNVSRPWISIYTRFCCNCSTSKISPYVWIVGVQNEILFRLPREHYTILANVVMTLKYQNIDMPLQAIYIFTVFLSSNANWSLKNSN